MARMFAWPDGLILLDTRAPLSDSSIWAAHIHTGGHATNDAKTEALWSIRLRVRPTRAFPSLRNLVGKVFPNFRTFPQKRGASPLSWSVI